MIPGSGPCYANASQGVHHPNQMYTDDQVIDSSSNGGTRGSEPQLRSFMCSLSILKEKVNQVQSYVNIFLPQGNHPHTTSGAGSGADHEASSSASSMALASMGTMIQEIIVTASSMMFNCQQMALGLPSNGGNNSTHMGSSSHVMQGSLDHNNNGHNHAFFEEGFYSWYADNVNTNTNTTNNNNNNNSSETTDSFRVVMAANTAKTSTTTEKRQSKENRKEAATKSLLLSHEAGYDIVELDAADLLAKYTHYCQVCGKGFKRDANLRMHMRAHGDEYKSSAALSNPLKKNSSSCSPIKVVPRKYSCPHEGCRWNKKHAKFQPLKSIICVKNHYKRSHCPKMYVCKRCNRKQFSVLSDLRTHEKHCGDLKWQCSCGTTFSRKDKLMGHVALFVGHSPMILNPLVGNNNNITTTSLDNKVDIHQHGLQIQFKDR